MSQRPFILFGLAVLAVAPSLAPSPAAVRAGGPDETFKQSEIDKLGKLIANYVSARSANKGLDKAQEDFKRELDSMEKRLKRDPLAMPDDMGKALWSSNEYDKNQKLHRGKVDQIDEPSYFEEKGKLGYALWLPAKYDPRKPYPVLLCIPDAGEDPKTHITEKWIDPTIRDNAIIACVTMPKDPAIWLDNGVQGKEGGAGNMLFTLSKLVHNYAVDFDRVYLAGRGRGVEAAVTFGARFPERFAGVIGRSGDAPAELPVENMNTLALFFAGAGGHATDLEEKLKKLGYTTLSRKDDASEADIWSWMQAHPRNPNPPEIILYPGSQSEHSYWLESVATDAQGTVYIKAKLDRTANTITVEGEGVSKFWVFFNDDMLDLDKPIKVVANGNEVSRTVQRSALMALGFLYTARSDPGRFYVNNMQFDLPPKTKPPPSKSEEKPSKSESNK
jgi:hypothetical protein